MKNLLIISLLFLACSSCQESPEVKFAEDGVSFTVPEGWKITDEENLYDEGYYLSIEKDGLNSSGLVTMTWVSGEFELEEWMETHKDGIKEGVIGESSSLIFGEEYEGKFNKLNTTSLNYTFNSFGLKHAGIIHIFYEKEKTFSILVQEAVEDKEKNKSGFKLIEKNFKVK